MNRKRLAISALILLSLGAVIGVYAGTVGVNDLFGFTNGYGFTDLNSTNINAGTEFYRGGDNYTRFIETIIPRHDQDLNTTDPVTFSDINITNTVTINGVPETGRTEYTVICVIENGRYIAYAPGWTILYNDTSAANCLQTALNYTTRGPSGNPVWDQDRRIDANTSVFIGPGDWDCESTDILLPSSNNVWGTGRDSTIIIGTGTAVFENMWANITYGASVNDLRLDADNKAYCIRWYCTNAALPAGKTYGGGLLDLKNLHLRNGAVYTVYLRTDVGGNAVFDLSDIRSTGTWYLDRVFDSKFSSFGLSKLILTGGCTANRFSGFYIGGGLDFNLHMLGDASQFSNYDNKFSQGVFDNPTRSHVRLDGFAQGNLFTGNTFSNLNWNSADDVYSAIVLNASSHHTTFTGNRFVNELESEDASTWKNVILEVAGTYGNIYVGNNYEDNEFSSIELWDRATGRLFNTTDPQLSNFENRKQTYYGGLTGQLTTGTIEYCSVSGVLSASTNDVLRSVYWTTDGWLANLRARLENDPGGATKWREVYLQFNSVDYLLTNITNLDFSGGNTSVVYIDTTPTAGLKLQIKTDPEGVPDASLLWFSWDFYPEASQWLNIPDV